MISSIKILLFIFSIIILFQSINSRSGPSISCSDPGSIYCNVADDCCGGYTCQSIGFIPTHKCNPGRCIEGLNRCTGKDFGCCPGLMCFRDDVRGDRCNSCTPGGKSCKTSENYCCYGACIADSKSIIPGYGKCPEK
ncbi:hypothetical protein ACQ4LE_010561 [Meloidogyne hapla]